MDTQKEQEIKLHRRLVNEYELRYKHDYAKIYHSFWNRQIIKNLPAEGNAFVLDCGCGSGALLPELTGKFKNVIGLDLSISLLKSIDQKSASFKGSVIGDTERMPFLDACFDIIICRGSLHHLPSPSSAFKNIYDKLKPGGFFVLSEPCSDSLILRLPRKLYREKSGRFSQGHKAFNSRELKEMLRACGFRIKEMRNFGLLAFPVCGLSDFLPVMRFLIFRRALTRIMIFFDEVFSRVPIIKNQCWHIIIKSQK